MESEKKRKFATISIIDERMDISNLCQKFDKMELQQKELERKMESLDDLKDMIQKIHVIYEWIQEKEKKTNEKIDELKRELEDCKEEIRILKSEDVKEKREDEYDFYT
jgi:cell division protein FtsB